MRSILLPCLAMVLAASAAQAQTLNCTPTSSLAIQKYPGARNIPNGNDLTRPAGKAVVAQGQMLIISGQVLDRNCMPVPQAIVEIWQVNPFGRWILAGADDLVSANPTFAGAGRTYTDTDGNFTFISLFPAATAKRAPNINVRVKAEGMVDFTTALYFENDSRNGLDEVYKKLAPISRMTATLRMSQGAGGELLATTTLVLPSKAPYRTY